MNKTSLIQICLAGLLFGLISSPGFSQRTLTYDFSKGFSNLENDGPDLKTIGETGKFEEMILKGLGDSRRKVFFFPINSGLQFDNQKADGMLDKSFTVELYFKFNTLNDWKRILDFKNRTSDNGPYLHKARLNFFNFITGQNIAVRPGEYIHYVYSRNHETGLVKMYIDGESKVEFKDATQEGILSEAGLLNFFQDDLVVNYEASDGAVALIRLYDRVLTPVLIKKTFKEIKEKGLESILPEITEAVNSQEPINQTTPPEQIEIPTVNTPEPEKFNISGKVYSSSEMKPKANVTVTARLPSRDSVIARATTATDGSYKLLLEDNKSYLIATEIPGYESGKTIVKAGSAGHPSESLINLTPEKFTSALSVLPFSQSTDSLTAVTQEKLDSLIIFLNTRPDLLLKIEGHTDNIGDFEKNLELSRHRAEKVRQYLASKGIDPMRMKIQGYGPTKPKRNNNYENHRLFNRRVEVWTDH